MSEMRYTDETVSIAQERARKISADFLDEVQRLLSCGAVDPQHHSRGLLYGVALESLADGFLRGERGGKDYKSLKRF